MYEGITKEMYMNLIELDKKMASIEKQVKLSRNKIRLKIDAYIPNEQIRLIGEL
ncbi:hypothetical protein [uncultured Ilyobacter sp.]|uniref:hypothetical protein n=1 Tax=uncultured Ilyobacter sp. TaxID=544433 RepID=UPI0029C00A4B|nr:hypothetical protein [uncultured Ilyobacter sp.]